MMGSLVGIWLAMEQMPQIVLLSRNARPRIETATVLQLGSGAAAAFHIIQCDTSNAEEVSVVMASNQGRRRLLVRLNFETC